jgi:hypothetical protein
MTKIIAKIEFEDSTQERCVETANLVQDTVRRVDNEKLRQLLKAVSNKPGLVDTAIKWLPK